MTAFTSSLNTLATWASFLTCVALAWEPVRAAAQRLCERLGEWSVALLLLPYLLATNAAVSAGDLLRFAVFLGVPVLVLRWRPPSALPFDRFQLLALLAIWFPVEPDLFLLIADGCTPGLSLHTLQLAEHAALPPVSGTLATDLELPLEKLTAFLLTLYLFTIRHPVRGLGYIARWSRADLIRALVAFAGFAAVAIPLALTIGFVSFTPKTPSLEQLVLRLLGGYLIVALPEEVLFRGLIQNWLLARSGRPALALVVSSAVFGLAHLNNPTGGFDVPNGAYAAMAFLAGSAYGWVFWRTGKATVSALTHALVNFLWFTAFK
ncbi:MAG: CPBP family intramembrane metalloprotease [Acidobacteriota bacterium]|nr:MAG: CPBP family intramembrane metalloprotease [Acidobacteriota bacterium]